MHRTSSSSPPASSSSERGCRFRHGMLSILIAEEYISSTASSSSSIDRVFDYRSSYFRFCLQTTTTKTVFSVGWRLIRYSISFQDPLQCTQSTISLCWIIGNNMRIINAQKKQKCVPIKLNSVQISDNESKRNEESNGWRSFFLFFLWRVQVEWCEWMNKILASPSPLYTIFYILFQLAYWILPYDLNRDEKRNMKMRERIDKGWKKSHDSLPAFIAFGSIVFVCRRRRALRSSTTNSHE